MQKFLQLRFVKSKLAKKKLFFKNTLKYISITKNHDYWNNIRFWIPFFKKNYKRRMVSVELFYCYWPILLFFVQWLALRIPSSERQWRDANNAAIEALSLYAERSRNFYGYRIGWFCRLWFTGPTYGAGNSHFVRLVVRWLGTSSGVQCERLRSVRRFRSIILIKSLIKSFLPCAVGYRDTE